MQPLEQRVDEFMAAPLAAAFFVLAARNRLSADQLATPGVASALASVGTRVLNPWRGQALEERTRALRAAGGLRALVTDVLADARSTWWTEPLRRPAQLLLTDSAHYNTPWQQDPTAITVPAGAADAQEVYAQRPRRYVLTSTALPTDGELGVRSGAHAELGYGASDWDAEYPVHQELVDVAASARVVEINSAGDWHRLVASYADVGAHPGSDLSLQSAAGIDNGPAPTWSAVAADLDGVHLTFAGLLSALYVPVTSDGVGTTTLWAWEWESTLWLRSAFTSLTPLADLLQPPEIEGLELREMSPW